MNKIKKEKRNLNLLKRSSKILALLTKRGGGYYIMFVCFFVWLFGFFLLKNKVLFKKNMFSLSNALQWIIELNNDLVSW